MLVGGQIAQTLRRTREASPSLRRLAAMTGSSETGQPGSEAIVAVAARSSQAAQLAELGALDGKAANLIGFLGVALSLLYTSTFADGHWTWALTTGTAALAAATVPLGYAAWPRSYRFGPSIDVLRSRFSKTEPAKTYGFITKTIEQGMLANQGTIKRKKQAIGFGTGMLVIGVLIVSASLLYSLSR